MDEVPDTKADCYSGGERAAMESYQRWRSYWLAPLLRLLQYLHVTPDHLTLLSLICGLAFCPLYFWAPAVAFVMLAVHALLDGIDGPLARFTGVDSRRGSFTDTASDQLIVVATTITVMIHPDPLIGILPGSLYIFLYTIVVVFAMVRNAMGIPYSWVVRPRLVVYAWLAIEKLILAGTPAAGSVNYLMWVCIALFLLKMTTGFLRIRERI